jgi:hypothetical protein
MTRDIRVLNMADGQKIEPDLVMKRIGELEYRNMGTFAKMFLFDSGKALVVGSGLRVEPYSGMVVNVPSGVCFQRSVDVILPCLEPTAQVVTVQAADGTPRTDIIEAQVKVVSDKSDTVQVMSVPSGSTSIVTLEEVKRDMRYYLSARAQKGTTTPTPATAAELTGTVAIATTIDLTEKYLLNLCNGEDGDYQEIDLRGSTPSATTRAEIIALINAAVGYTMASTGTGNVIVLTGEGTGQSSYFAIQPPVTDADKDALEIVFGVSAGGAYRWPYVGDDEWFKLAEIDVGASTTDLTDTEIRNIDEKSTWSDGDDVKKCANLLGGSVPVGSIIAWLHGYFGDGSNGSYTSVSMELSDEWKECDGSALNDADSPIFNGAGRYLPNLTDDRFLMGDVSGSAGGIGGDNDITVQDQPAFTYPNHKHQVANYTGDQSPEYTLQFYNAAGTAISMIELSPTGSSGATRCNPATVATQNFYSKTDGGGSCIRTQDVTFASNSNLPKYLSVRYIMRIK